MCPSSQYSASRLLKEYASTAQTITKNAMIIILPLPPAFVPCKRRTFENISVVVRALTLTPQRVQHAKQDIDRKSSSLGH